MTKIYFAKTEFNNGTWSMQLLKQRYQVLDFIYEDKEKDETFKQAYLWTLDIDTHSINEEIIK